MPWFTEDPMPMFILGGVALLVLLVFLLKTGRGVILLAMAGVVLCMVAAAAIDSLVVTDRELIEQTLYEAAAAAERNDLDAVVAFISPSSPHLGDEARRWIGQVILETVELRGVKVEMNDAANPPTAMAHLWWFAWGKLRRGDTIRNNAAGRLTVEFRKEGDRWLVTDYERR